MAFVQMMLDGRLLLLLSSPFVGSFLGVVAERWPRGETFVFGRSQCLHCKHVLGLRDLVPVIAWLVSRARCRYCGQRIPIRYPAIEIGALIVAIWSVAALPAGLAWVGSAFGWALLALAVIDLEWLLLPHALTRSLAVAGLVINALCKSGIPFDQLIGAVLGYGAMAGVAWLYRKHRGRRGLGEGDANLFGALGAWVGWQGLPSILVYAGISGLLSLAIRAWKGQPISGTMRLPFGPHLCFGGWLVWIYGPLYFDW
jgi:leader peptidase (prepilin peptidase)/N-methyltransferase